MDEIINQSKPALILIADDDRSIRFLLRRVLERDGYVLEEAEDGAQALSAYERLQPEVVLLDAMMPGMDGFTTCTRLRALPGGDRTPVLMITALSDNESVDRAFEVGATDYLIKPIHYAVVRQRVRRLLQAYRTEAALLQSERLYRAVVEDQTELICRWRPDGTLTFVNEAFCRYFGKSRAELLAHNFITLIPVVDREIVKADLVTLTTSLSPASPTTTDERRMVIASGEIRWQQWTTRAIFEEQSGLVEFQGVGRDITEHKQMEEALRESEARNRALINALPDMMLRLSHDGTLLDFHTQAPVDLLVSLETIIGTNIYQLPIPSEVADRLMSAIDKALETGMIQSVEYTLSEPGDIRDYEARIVTSGQDEVVTIVRDVTERKHAEEAAARRARITAFSADVGLALTNGRALREMLQSCAEAMVTHFDAAFARVWTFNPAEKMLELQASAGMYTHLDGPYGRVPVGKFKIGLIAQERRPHLTNDILNDVHLGDRDWAKRESMVAFAGYPLIVEGQLMGVMAMFARQPLLEEVLQAMDTVANTIALSIDRKRAEEALLQSEERYRFIYNKTPAMLHSIDREGRLISVSDYWLETLGYERSEVLGRKSADFFTPESRRYAQEVALPAFFEAGFSKDIPYQLVKKNGDIIDVLLSGIAKWNDAGEVEYSLTVMVDVTERNQMQARMIATQKLADLGTLAAGVAHEINTPLQVITGLSQNLLDRLDQGALDLDRLRRKLEIIHRNGWRCAEIVRSLRTYAHASVIQVEPNDLNTLVQDTLLLIEHQLKSWSNITVVTNLVPELPPLSCDRNQITQTLINLLTNARDAITEMGEISIYTSYDPESSRLKLQVTDTGPGIPESIQAKIFDPFFTTKPLGQGTGLGLSIVAGIVHAYGGEIKVDSTPNVGTTFTLLFPTEARPMPIAAATGTRGRFDDTVYPLPNSSEPSSLPLQEMAHG